jgi:8-oxo-dGTP diphosphatase
MKERFRLSVSVFVIVLDEGRVLLLRRAHTGWQDGCYSLPAGAVDGGEPLDHAASRELREETGLVAAPSDLRLAHLLHCRRGDRGDEWLGAFFIAERWAGDPALTELDKHDAIGWFASDNLPEPTIAYTSQGLRFSIDGRTFSTFDWREACGEASIAALAHGPV